MLNHYISSPLLVIEMKKPHKKNVLAEEVKEFSNHYHEALKHVSPKQMMSNNCRYYSERKTVVKSP